MTPEQIAWAAGLFEGEGSFFLNVDRKNHRCVYYSTAELKMCDEDIVRRLHELVGEGTVRCGNRSQPNRRESWAWRISGRRRVKAFFELIEPWLGARRRLQGLKVIETGL